jgi:hypothetical protein
MKNELKDGTTADSSTTAQVPTSASLAQKTLLCDVFKGKLAILKEDYSTDDECSFGVLIKKDSKVYIKGNKVDGICYVEYLDFGFSIDAARLNIA